jgi:hypothetical protein
VRRDIIAANRLEADKMIQTGSDPIAPMIIPGDLESAAKHHDMRARPRQSRVTHLAIFAVTTCIALLFLYAAMPLTVGATDRLSTFIGGADIYVIPTPLPTATPTPQPSVRNPGPIPSNPGTQAIIAEIQSVFGSYASSALVVARCESSYNPLAYNPIPVLGSHAMGVFQILYPITWQRTAQAAKSPYDANANILAAHEIFVNDGYSWREWACASALG